MKICMLMLILFSGCAGFTPSADEATFWTQKVTVSAWGFSMVTPYGPFNLGYLSWQRNVDNPQNLNGPDASKLPIPLPGLKATIP